MTDKRKDEMQFDTCPFCKKQPIRNPQYPKDFVQCDNGGECPIYGYEIPLKMWPISPPVPDDVAEAVKCARDWLTIFGGNDTKDDEWLETLIRAASTPSAEVEYWKDKCYTAESDAEIHAQCHDKVFDEKKALEAEVRALQKIPLSASTSGEFIAPDYIKGWNAAIEALNQPHTERK